MRKTSPLTKDEFNSWLEKIEHITLDCNVSSRNLEKLDKRHFHSPEWQGISGFLSHLWTQYYFTLITQLAKLFCDGKQDLRLALLVQRLRATSTSPFIVNGLMANLHDECKSVLPYCWNDKTEMSAGLTAIERSLHTQANVIEQLKKIRNEHIAHTSASNDGTNVAPSIHQVVQLVALAKQIITDVRAGLGMASLSFETDHAWSIDPLFEGWENRNNILDLRLNLFRLHPKGNGQVFLECNGTTGYLRIGPIKG